VKLNIYRSPLLFVIIAFQLMLATPVRAQLSPGDLTQVHAELEGISNCTQCHTLGKKISSDKCLSCHETIKSLLEGSLGYHSSTAVRSQDCFTCHSEHHGRNFEMIRFDTRTFDHELTGYTLSGTHARLECAECHKPEFIADKTMSKREGTFLGLTKECLSCHEDFHQKTMSSDCVSCHNTEAFRPAELFDHNSTDFPLAGRHKETDCIKCHEMTIRNGRDIQEFAGIAFANCSSCHDDAHQSRFGNDCKQCHNEESFHAIAGRTDFDHSKTAFPLRGQHHRIDCSSCHDADAEAQNVFKDFAHLNAINCTNCHDDVHENKFGPDCRSCHNEKSFKDVAGIDDFDHNMTAFLLEGMHTEVDCRSCHETKMTDPLPHNQCISCHADYHEGRFVSTDNTIQDCAECHSVEGFDISSFTIEQHNEGNFTLEGSHLATPCFSCHLKDEHWRFSAIGEYCVDCHDNIHKGKLDEKYYPEEDCKSCHTVDMWSSVNFDHSRTVFKLEGIHASTACIACHLDEKSSGYVFTGMSMECTACHDDSHHRQFEEAGVTKCNRCHEPEYWKPSRFEHNSTKFALEGAHSAVKCDACHKEVTIENATYTLYRIVDFECASCHQ
jgi:hypothetical protein